MLEAVILDSVGIEIEFANTPMSKIKGKIPRGWKIERDGSLTRDVHILGDREISLELNSLRRFTNIPSGRIGGELVSPILSFEKVQKLVTDLNYIIDLLNKVSEQVSDLASIHVHIYAGKYPPLTFFCNYIRLIRAIEAPVFRLSVGESVEHRGNTNDDYLYCRPVTGDGPQFVRDSNTGVWTKAFDLDKLLENAKTVNDMIRGWCRSDYQPNKWVPGRYYWTHFVSMYRQGTLEFRQFNQTMHTKYILAWLDLSRAIVKKAWAGGCDLPEFGLGRKTPIGSTDPYHFDDFLQIITPDLFRLPGTVATLEELWYKSRWQRGPNPQVSHLCRNRGNRVPFDEIRRELIPDEVTEDYISSIWNDGHERGH